MAEVLGAVASGVTMGALAGQIALSVLKLKSFLEAIKDAPENIRFLIDEIESVQFLLADIEDGFPQNPYAERLVQNHSISRCLLLCERGVEKLTRLVNEIDTELHKVGFLRRKLAGVKLVWRRDRLDKYNTELESSVRLLALSYQVYTR